MPKRTAISYILPGITALTSAGCSNETGRALLDEAIEACGASAFARVAKSNSPGTSPFIVDFKGAGEDQHAAGACINTKVEAKGLKRPTMTFGPEFGPEVYGEPLPNPPTLKRESD